MAWAAGKMGLFTGFAALLAPLSAAFVGGTGLVATITAGALDGTGGAIIGNSLINLLRGCPWNNGLGGEAVGGGLGGGLGAGLGKLLGLGVEYLAKNLSKEIERTLFHLGQDGLERASPELLDAMQRHGREIIIANESSDWALEALQYLDSVGAEASSMGTSSIILRENPSKSTALEEFLHGTQARLGIDERLNIRSAIEAHVKDFMIRHQQMLGLSDEDVQILKQLMELGL